VELSAANKRAGSDDQAMGSSITYMRRYTLTAALGLAQADDDGAGGGSTPAKRLPAKASRPGRAPKQQGVTKEEVEATDQPLAPDRDDMVAKISRGEEYLTATEEGAEWLSKQKRPEHSSPMDELATYLEALTIMAKQLQSQEKMKVDELIEKGY